MSSVSSRFTPLLRRQLLRSFSTSNPYGADHARIVEVGPRDGLQNEKKSIPLQTKIELINRLARTGVTHMEAGSFVPAKWVPQMASTAEVFENIVTQPPASPHSIAYNYLIPNIRGLENLISVFDRSKPDSDPQLGSYPTPPSTPPPTDPDSDPTSSTAHPTPTSTPSLSPSPPNTTEISLFAAATESFSRVNTNCSIAESLARCRPIIALAKQTHALRVRGYISVALGCPYEGPDVDSHVVASMTASLLEMGCDEVSVADTTGMGTAPRTRELLATLKAAGIRAEDIALHFHDTYGQALVNTLVGLEHGVRVFDSSVGGLGGCPYSKGATGNVSTEDLVHLLHSLGVETGVDLDEMARIGEWVSGELGRGNESRAGKATMARLREREREAGTLQR